MTQNAALKAHDEPQALVRDPDAITTRFGDIAVDAERVITFDQGLYGFEHQRRFLLTQVPGWPDFFNLLQSVDDPSLSLIVLPLESGNGPIDPKDFEGACAALGYDPEATAIIGIVTMRDDANNQIFTVNLKAPLIIDSRNRKGCQHVFASEKYPMRHPLETQQESEG